VENNGEHYIGGRGGIRTHGTLAGTPVFKTGALNHSATLPDRSDQALSVGQRRTQRELGSETRAGRSFARSLLKGQVIRADFTNRIRHVVVIANGTAMGTQLQLRSECNEGHTCGSPAPTQARPIISSAPAHACKMTERCRLA
jgi:hypothetical protein